MDDGFEQEDRVEGWSIWQNGFGWRYFRILGKIDLFLHQRSSRSHFQLKTLQQVCHQLGLKHFFIIFLQSFPLNSFVLFYIQQKANTLPLSCFYFWILHNLVHLRFTLSKSCKISIKQFLTVMMSNSIRLTNSASQLATTQNNLSASVPQLYSRPSLDSSNKSALQPTYKTLSKNHLRMTRKARSPSVMTQFLTVPLNPIMEEKESNFTSQKYSSENKLTSIRSFKEQSESSTIKQPKKVTPIMQEREQTERNSKLCYNALLASSQSTAVGLSTSNFGSNSQSIPVSAAYPQQYVLANQQMAPFYFPSQYKPLITSQFRPPIQHQWTAPIASPSCFSCCQQQPLGDNQWPPRYYW